MMPIMTLLLFTVPILYALVVTYFIISLVTKREPVSQDTANCTIPGISIVIPFRNEARNLAGLIESLDSQTYAGAVEIVLVNDCSTDNYKEIIGQHPRHGNLPVLRVIDSVISPLRQRTSKQQALELGISEAAHDWIALTDADMLLDPAWLEKLLQPALAGAKLVFGHTAIRRGKRKSVFTWLQSFQLETLFSFAYAFYHSGMTGSCMGNNMLLSRKAFMDIGGFEAIGRSIVEDRDILVAFRRNKIPVAGTVPFFPTAITAPCETIGLYLHQVLRWARGGFRLDSNLSLFGALAAVHTVLFLFAIAGTLPFALSTFLGFNWALTWIFIGIAFKKIGSAENPLLFPVFFITLLVELLAMLLLVALRRPVVWKERKI